MIGSKLLVLAAALLCGACAAQTAPSHAAAEAIYNERRSDPYWKLDYTGEDFAWHTAYGMSAFLERYEETGDTVFLDWGVKYYDALLARMAEGPDGYKGWIGPYEYNDKYWCDVHVGDAILFDGILDFAYAASRDPKLKAKYGDKVRRYVEIARRDVIEKWDARGTWREDGPFGAYAGWDKYGMPGQYKNWEVKEECADRSNLSLPFNKQIDVGVVALRIWQITGEEKYRVRAEKIFGFMKSRMQRFKDEYHWNYFEPAGQWDLDLAAKGHVRHWIGVHPERNYQSGEVVNILKAYNAGIVFIEDDIRGIVNTNLKMMWNHDAARPLFANSNADLRGPLTPEVYAGKHAGELWSALTQVDGVARALQSERNRRSTWKHPPSYARRDVQGAVKIPEVYAQFPLGNVRTVVMGAVMPSIFAQGEKAVVACKLIEPGQLEVALYSKDGREKLGTLYEGKQDGGADGLEGIFYFPFNRPETKPGDYRVRWTVAGDGYREFPITVHAAK